MRATTTAQLAMAQFASSPGAVPPPIYVDERLRDRELGILDTLTSHGVRTRYPGEAERRHSLGKFYYRPPGGESWTDLALRLRSFLASLTGDTDHFTHDAIITMTRYLCCGLTEREVLDLAAHNPIGNASISRFTRHENGSWQVADYNAQDHLVQPDGRGPPTLENPMSIPTEIVTPALLRAWPLPEPGASKHSRGHIAVIGGSRSTPGALALAGIAALRVGAGVLALAAPEPVAIPLAVAVPEASVCAFDEQDCGVAIGWPRWPPTRTPC